ncbi:MAG TPA: hydrogenase expression/formation protein HypE [Vicinamibacterales bacterium]|nr:hydrogenase expression/formation protein HypE [Vicinamibacterales bacterium]
MSATATTTARVAMKHGAGGRAMRRLIEQVFLRNAGAVAAAMDDGAAIPIEGGWLVVTTDSHVIQPIVFPGGDIGRLAVAGTVNDLAMMGATEPLGLTCGVILEEGFAVDDLAAIQASIAAACEEAGTSIVAGDTKVMRRGEIDGIVINTTGVAIARTIVRDAGLAPGDRIIVTGTIGDHGMAVMAVRQQFEFREPLRSDVAPLNGLVRAALAAGGTGISAMKDPTRGGVASALHEMASKARVGIVLDEASLPVRASVRAAADLLGIDPLLIANEGKALIGVRASAAEAVLAALRAHPYGADAAVVGTVVNESPGSVMVDTGFGRRLLSEPDGELLPRIC